MIRKLFEQTSLQIVGKLITSLSTLLFLSLISRTYGEYGVGIYTLALTYISFFLLIIDGGFNAYILSRLKSNEEVIWRQLLGSRILLSIFFFAISLLGILLWPRIELDFKIAVILGSFSIFGSAVYVSANCLFQRRLRYDLSIIPASMVALVTLGVGWVLIRLGFGVAILTVASSLGWAVALVASLMLSKKYVALSPIWNVSFLRDLLIRSWPISLTLFLNVIYFRADSFLLSYFRNMEEVGVYNFSYQIFQASLVIPTFIMNGFYPMLIKQYNSDLKKFKSRTLYYFLAFLLIGMVIFTFLNGLAPLLIQMLTKDGGFEGSVKTLKILSLSLPAFFGSAYLMWNLIILGDYKKMALIYLTGLGVNLLLNFIFIPKMGYIAAAWITGISECLILTAQIIILRKVLFFKR